MQPLQADYFTAYHNVKLIRDANGVGREQHHEDIGRWCRRRTQLVFAKILWDSSMPKRV